jgi:glycosyltransferase involved in cell wall biosynthesis
MKVLLNTPRWTFSRWTTDLEFIKALRHLSDAYAEVEVALAENHFAGCFMILAGILNKLLKLTRIRNLFLGSILEILMNTISVIPKSIMNKYRPDVVFSLGNYPLNLPSSIPVIWHTAFTSEIYMKEAHLPLSYRLAEIRIKRWLGQKSTLIVVPVPNYKQRMVKAMPELEVKIRTVPIYFPYLDAIENESVIKKNETCGVNVLFVGNQARRKGLPAAIEAFLSISESSRVPMTLTIVSNFKDGRVKIPDDARLRILSNLDKKLVLTLMRCSQIFCFPSLAESFGAALVEAMASGCAVVTSNREPLDWVVGDSGILVDPMDTTQIAQAMERLIYDRELRTAKALQARERFFRVFHPSVVGNEYLEVFREAIEIFKG